MQIIHVCSKGHEQPGHEVQYGHVIQCRTCQEVCVKVYPQGGGREWIVMTPRQVRFHNLIAVEETDDVVS